MKENICEYQQRIVKNPAAAGENPELANHIAHCADCREAVKVALWMKNFSDRSQPAALPKPGFIRWKAQIVEKQAQAARATKPIVWTQIAAVLATIATLVFLTAKNQTSFEPVLQLFSASVELVAAPMLIGFAVAGLVCLMFVYKWRDQTGKK